MGKRLFIVGTGTDVGKTYVTGLIVKALRADGQRAAYYKAAMSGNERGADGHLRPGDALLVKQTAGIEQPVEEMCPYVYEAAVSPHLAARIEGGAVDRSVVLAGLDALSDRYDYVTMEGSGGIICPLRYDDKTLWLADLIRARDMPCLLVADAGLGTINAVALTASFMRTNGLSLRAIIFDRYDPTSEMHRDNLAMCETLTGCRVVACVREGDDRLRLPVHEIKALYG